MTNTFAKSWQKMVRIVAGGDTITATNNHPFYLPQLGKYLRADSLRQNMKLLALTGALLTVHAVEAFDTTLQVYNFEVEEYHNYFVGEEGVLVHNDCVFVKMGLRNLPQQLPDDPIFDIFNNVFGTTPEAAVKRISFLQDYGNLSGQAKIDFENFFRAQDLITANPNISLADILIARGDRVKAWEVLRETPLATQADWLSYVDNAVSTHGLNHTQAAISARVVEAIPSTTLYQNTDDLDALYDVGIGINIYKLSSYNDKG